MRARDFPQDAILIARGKYSTLASERRDALKGLQDDMTTLASYASRILRHASGKGDDLAFMDQELDAASRCLGSAHLHTQTLFNLAPVLAELKPLAWGGKDSDV